MCIFKKLIKKCGVNDPTPVDIFVIENALVTTIAAPTNTPPTVYNTITTAPTLDVLAVSGNKWKSIQARRSSIKFTDVIQGEQDTNQRRLQKLELFFPEADEETFYNLSQALGSELIVGWTNGNLKSQLWGVKTNPVLLTKCDFDSSKGGWDLVFEREARTVEVVPFYTGTFDIS